MEDTGIQVIVKANQQLRKRTARFVAGTETSTEVALDTREAKRLLHSSLYVQPPRRCETIATVDLQMDLFP